MLSQRRVTIDLQSNKFPCCCQQSVMPSSVGARMIFPFKETYNTAHSLYSQHSGLQTWDITFYGCIYLFVYKYCVPFCPIANICIPGKRKKYCYITTEQHGISKEKLLSNNHHCLFSKFISHMIWFLYFENILFSGKPNYDSWWNFQLGNTKIKD